MVLYSYALCCTTHRPCQWARRTAARCQSHGEGVAVAREWLRHASLLVCWLAYRCECGECLWRLEYWRGEQVETIRSDSVTVRPEKDCSMYEFAPRSGTNSCVWRGMAWRAGAGGDRR